MSKTLVVVESPAKAKTIKKYLGPQFDVKASVGHIKDLPRTAERRQERGQGSRSRSGSSAGNRPVLGVDVANGFKPHYEIIPGKEKILKELREAARAAGKVLLATDPDREGEAIAWHLSQELDKPREAIYRVLFNELTERTIKEAVSSPARLDENRYNAQQARRILDRIVGYQLSPLLWDKVQYGLSAGRVQSVTLRLIVDRQDAIDTFVPQESWNIAATLEANEPPPFEAKLVEEEGGKVEISDLERAASLVKSAEGRSFQVEEVKRTERTRKPLPPFITSTLQQEASRRLRMTGTRAMRVAQQLYEGIELGKEGAVGLITYMRTYSPPIAPEALGEVRRHIAETFGKKYLPEKPHVYKGRKTAWEAHEGIRPTSMDLAPEKVARFLDKDQLALYSLVWNRFIASQMTPAVFDLTTVHIRCDGLLFRASGSVMKFDGFLKVYRQEEPSEERDNDKDELDRPLPRVEKGDRLEVQKLSARQHFSQPPPAFNEASLIKELEERGIGRPSTYAEIVSTIQKRKYVEVTDKRFRPTLLGRIIAKLLLESFPQLLDAGFTAQMESSLDLIEEGRASWTGALENFYEPFQSDLKQAKEKMKNIKREGIVTGEVCPECGRELLLRSGRYGLFMGCTGYPECGYTRNIAVAAKPQSEPQPTEDKCPTCCASMLLREGRTGRFLACSGYPACKTTRPLTTGVACPKCGEGELANRRSKKGKSFYSCSRFPSCDYSLWNKPVAQPCPNPDCDSPIMEERFDSKNERFLRCPKCRHKVKSEGAAATN